MKKIKFNHKIFVHLVGLYRFCKMMHGAYNVKSVKVIGTRVCAQSFFRKVSWLTTEKQTIRHRIVNIVRAFRSLWYLRFSRRLSYILDVSPFTLVSRYQCFEGKSCRPVYLRTDLLRARGLDAKATRFNDPLLSKGEFPCTTTGPLMDD